MRTANSYRDQLDRVRRWLERIENQSDRRDVDYQDKSWAFFQFCWHLKDWVLNDAVVPASTKKIVKDAAHASKLLLVCRDMANGTKHMLNPPEVSAAHSYTATRIVPSSGTPSVVSTVIDMGDGTT